MAGPRNCHFVGAVRCVSKTHATQLDNPPQSELKKGTRANVKALKREKTLVRNQDVRT